MNLLRHYRKVKGITQQKLAQKLHITQYDICLIERNERLPWPAEAFAIANYFGVKIQAIFPDGLKQKAERPADYVDPRIYNPPPAPVRVYPDEFKVRCYHCGQLIAMRGDDAHLPDDEDPKCVCGARFYSIVPLEEAANV